MKVTGGGANPPSLLLTFFYDLNDIYVLFTS